MPIDYSKEYVCKGCPCANVDSFLAFTRGWARPSEWCNLGLWGRWGQSDEPPKECKYAFALKKIKNDPNFVITAVTKDVFNALDEMFNSELSDIKTAKEAQDLIWEWISQEGEL